ncbi:hypothetical protein ABZ501_06425 [Streptomyces sp. NPDC019922]|uniref:hypothetical protein n=1 Tax=Streptomyces TaxID=1883 RepID=UPI002E0D2472|nr:MULTISPECIES: hypothetical protein [Streptomyces]MEE1779436.1 hypothetical protein [Streptomyces sp. JV181]WSK30527.1 hypothetical protein OG483_22815 [[Kitasatospora] papulosa]
MSNEMAWLLHGVFLGMMLAAMVRLVFDAVTAQRAAEAARAASALALKSVRGDSYLLSLRQYRLDQKRETA